MFSSSGESAVEGEGIAEETCSARLEKRADAAASIKWGCKYCAN